MQNSLLRFLFVGCSIKLSFSLFIFISFFFLVKLSVVQFCLARQVFAYEQYSNLVSEPLPRANWLSLT